MAAERPPSNSVGRRPRVTIELPPEDGPSTTTPQSLLERGDEEGIDKPRSSRCQTCNDLPTPFAWYVGCGTCCLTFFIITTAMFFTQDVLGNKIACGGSVGRLLAYLVPPFVHLLCTFVFFVYSLIHFCGHLDTPKQAGMLLWIVVETLYVIPVFVTPMWNRACERVLSLGYISPKLAS